jgi:hypothetical protein
LIRGRWAIASGSEIIVSVLGLIVVLPDRSIMSLDRVRRVGPSAGDQQQGDTTRRLGPGRPRRRQPAIDR